MWTVYILKERGKKWHYVGSSNDIERRIAEHNAGKVSSTKSHLPLDLVYTMHFDDEVLARKFEHKIKKQRLLKEQIIRTIER